MMVESDDYNGVVGSVSPLEVFSKAIVGTLARGLRLRRANVLIMARGGAVVLARSFVETDGVGVRAFKHEAVLAPLVIQEVSRATMPVHVVETANAVVIAVANALRPFSKERLHARKHATSDTLHFSTAVRDALDIGSGH